MFDAGFAMARTGPPRMAGSNSSKGHLRRGYQRCRGLVTGAAPHCRDVLRYWLTWLRDKGLLDHNRPPGDRATAPLVSEFVHDLRLRLAPYSVVMLVGGIKRGLEMMAPAHDWQWMRPLYRKFEAIGRADPGKAHSHRALARAARSRHAALRSGRSAADQG